MVDTLTRLAILGSTGSIGQQTLDIARTFPHRFQVIGLTAGNNTELLAKQINEFRPRFIHFQKEPAMSDFAANHKQLSPEEIASHPDVDLVVMATSGKAGLLPTLAALKAGKKVALANKEALVMAGELVTREAEQNRAQILPLDSEHSAIWQCLNGEPKPATRILLTGSGGPFRGYTTERLKEVTLEQALNHPSWRMGEKVTIDSATLMNKGLEIIEAHWLFRMPYEKIQVVIHPQCIIHSMVEFADGSVKAQLSHPDMRLPIQYALSFPKRWHNPNIRRLDWTEIGQFTFEEADCQIFPCLTLAREAGKKGETFPAVLCAADEVAVELFLDRRIKFFDIARLVEQVLEQHRGQPNPTLDDILAADDWARNRVTRLLTEVR